MTFVITLQMLGLSMAPLSAIYPRSEAVRRRSERHRRNAKPTRRVLLRRGQDCEYYVADLISIRGG